MNATISMANKLRGTVTMANQKINGGASPYPITVGPADICSFSDGADSAPIPSLSVAIEPVQDLHGYDYPWPAGGGTNKIAWSDGIDFTLKGVRYYVSDGKLFLNGTSSGETSSGDGTFEANFKFKLPAGTYYFTRGSYPNAVYLIHNVDGVRENIVTNNGVFTLSAEEELWVGFYVYNKTFSNLHAPIQIVQGSTNPAIFSPYSNICPISGWTEVEINHSDEDTSDPETVTVSLGQTVYGGTLDAVSGKCYARPYYSSYSGQTLIGPWISSHDKYVAGTTPTTGAQVVDMGGTVTEISVTGISLSSYLGKNNVWADAGQTTLTYYRAQSSVVAVWDRTRHIYTSIPLGMIRYETYQITPQQTIDLDSYRSENGNLLRNPVATKCKLEFNTPLMTDTQWAGIWNIIKVGFNNNTERKLKLKYYDTLSASYKTGYFYVPDVQTTIRNIEETEGVINYNEIRLAFIEY